MAADGGSRSVSRDALLPGDPLPPQVVPPDAAAVDAAFTEETRRVMARRVPLGVLCFVGIVGVAGLIEVSYYPDRLDAFGVSLALELLFCAALVVANRREGLRPWVISLALTATIGVTACMTGYVVSTGASADALAFAFIIFLTGAALLYPWGARGQVPFAIAVVLAHVLALAVGVRGSLPLPYPIVAVLGSGVTSVLGAIFLEMHRRAIFKQRLLLEQSRDLQLAMLYDVSRTVTATLELHEVLRLVCQSVLGALRVERLWLIWRESSDGELNGLEALRNGSEVSVAALGGDPSRWEALLAGGSSASPVVRSGTPEERAVLGADLGVAARLLHLPLVFHGELVGVILTDLAEHERDLSDSFLDFAATLGNTAAIAVGHARLHALLLNHSVELRRLSSQGLAMVEDILRRISRELHDNTCQALMTIKLDLALLERRFAGESVPLRGAVDDLRQRLMRVMHEVREMSHLIYPPVLDDFGAVAAIESMAAKVNEASGMRIDVECSDPDARFAPPIELLLFRVFQEAFTNVLKHAAATRVVVRVVPEEHAVRLEVEDDGRGFDAIAYFRRPPPSAGVGLLGMRERVGHQGGSFNVVSRAGSGTRIVIRVPAEPLGVAHAAAV
jgi:signal transduction histidine kinase